METPGVLPHRDCQSDPEHRPGEEPQKESAREQASSRWVPGALDTGIAPGTEGGGPSSSRLSTWVTLKYLPIMGTRGTHPPHAVWAPLRLGQHLVSLWSPPTHGVSKSDSLAR